MGIKPNIKDATIVTRVPEETRARVVRESRRLGGDPSKFVRWLIDEYFDKKRKRIGRDDRQ